MVEYDEFAMLADNAAEVGLAFDAQPQVARVSVDLPSGLAMSALKWGSGPAEVVLVHGGAQNAHTWDTVALALDRPLVAIDLPGHGHSDHRPDHHYGPESMAPDVAEAIEVLAPEAGALVGMSLGGLTAVCLAADRPELARRLGVIDVTPGTDGVKAGIVTAFISGPQFFESFDAILTRTMEYNPTRSESSLRRGILHNAKELPDGRWTWRYDRGIPGAKLEAETPTFIHLWDKVERLSMPVALWQGGASPVVGAEDVEEWMKLCPHSDHVVVEGAGHSIQGDKPLELADLIGDLLIR